MLPSVSTEAPQGISPAATFASEVTNDLGAVLSPSQARTFLDCAYKWYAKHALGLPDPPNGSFVRGRVVHKMAELYYRARLAGKTPDLDDMHQPFEEAWDREAAMAAFGADENVDELKRQAAVLTRKYLEEVAPEIQPAAVERPVTGTIGGVCVRAFIDLVDTRGRIIDLKTAAKSPSGVSADYAFQVATYRQLAPQASGLARLDTLVANKTPKIVT